MSDKVLLWMIYGITSLQVSSIWWDWDDDGWDNVAVALAWVTTAWALTMMVHARNERRDVINRFIEKGQTHDDH